mmetsp:Transcript_27541/g.69204  ORF Transcript_27541/g.69204 Transcript_27541/m.69204 type:complete len:99 (+) Transcript_27541:176-472(+)
MAILVMFLRNFRMLHSHDSSDFSLSVAKVRARPSEWQRSSSFPPDSHHSNPLRVPVSAVGLTFQRWQEILTVEFRSLWSFLELGALCFQLPRSPSSQK